MITFKSLTLGSLLVLATGCAGNSGDGTKGSQGNVNGATPGGSFSPGCTQSPACGSCQACYDTCFCVNQNAQTCVNMCKSGGSPVGSPTGSPTVNPTSNPTVNPTSNPTVNPTSNPTVNPTSNPTVNPTSNPTVNPTSNPTVNPTSNPTVNPTSTPPGGTSVTLTTDSFDVLPGQERFMCQNFANPNNGFDKAIVRSESFMTPGSHHMFGFLNSPATASGLQECGGLEFSDYVHSAQTPQQANEYPANMGRLWQGGYGVRILAHYLNPASSTVHASVSINFDVVDTKDVQTYVAGIFLNNATLRVSPGQQTASHTFRLPQQINLMSGVSHMHKTGIKFVAQTSDGRILYEGTDWDEPQSTVFNPAMPINAGTTITWTCTYNNTTGKTLTFGESASINEMCIFSGMFYPSPGGGNINSVI